MLRVRTIDAHAEGEPLRLIVEGFPSPRGRTMLEKREWVKKHADHLRRALMLESTVIQYDEPPAWFYTVRQSLGAALLRAGAHAEAEQVLNRSADTEREGR